MATSIHRAGEILYNGLKLKCPLCGRGSLYRSLFKMEEYCSYCNLRFEREQGYFVGAIYINVLATEFLLIPIYFICILFIPSIAQMINTVLALLAVALPILFYHHSRSLWLSFDYIVNMK